MSSAALCDGTNAAPEVIAPLQPQSPSQPQPQAQEAPAHTASQPTPEAAYSPVPLPILTLPTHNVAITAPHPLHAPSLAQHANNPRVAANLRTTFPAPYTLSHADAWIALNLSLPTQTNFFICTPPTPSSPAGAAIGAIGLKLPLPAGDVDAHTAELGYWLGEPYWGRGLMSAAVRGFVAWVFANRPGVRRLWAGVFAGNAGSVRCLENAGFAREGVMRGHVWKEGWGVGGERDMVVYGLLRREWEAGV